MAWPAALRAQLSGTLMRRLAAIGLASLVACGACGGPSGPSAAERYESAVAAYNEVIVRTRPMIEAGDFRPAFAELAQAEEAFASALASIEFPEDAAANASSLAEVSRRLAALYREAVSLTDETALRQSFGRINAARAQGTRLSSQVRAALDA